jgi:hypothetical protein
VEEEGGAVCGAVHLRRVHELQKRREKRGERGERSVVGMSSRVRRRNKKRRTEQREGGGGEYLREFAEASGDALLVSLHAQRHHPALVPLAGPGLVVDGQQLRELRDGARVLVHQRRGSAAGQLGPVGVAGSEPHGLCGGGLVGFCLGGSGCRGHVE